MTKRPAPIYCKLMGRIVRQRPSFLPAFSMCRLNLRRRIKACEGCKENLKEAFIEGFFDALRNQDRLEV